jgi:hypothetical protein
VCYSLVQPFPPGVVPARNRVLFHITNSRKLPPPARFILQGADFHWGGYYGAIGTGGLSLFKDWEVLASSGMTISVLGIWRFSPARE